MKFYLACAILATLIQGVDLSTELSVADDNTMLAEEESQVLSLIHI